MRIPRIHVAGPIVAGEPVALDDSASNHVVRVLRLAPGAPLRLFDGRGGQWRATLASCGKRGASALAAAHEALECESPLAVVLAQGIARGERMDYALQKAVELGVQAIRPVFTARSNVQLDADRLDKRLAHWRAVIVAACEQCGRNRLPVLAAPLRIEALLAETAAGDGGLRLVLDPLAQHGLRALAPPPGPVTLLVGPEGGLAEAELAAATAAGWQGVRLGPRVLRTETAGVAALAALAALWGDLG
ncbi:MAG: 16S rRNA (uracil(1498)-N(3))-methyltransferase [Lysobacterales bacterium]|nr:MAG: 16S rRNA (uracil(1498)-N(3))-methyltransferase [Xanthomonadales bacterium]